MDRSIKIALQRTVPAFKINVNVTDFQYRKSSLKQKLQKQYIPYYWEKCNMNQKVVAQSSEDRLCELTTGQIDRIIDMQKIRSLLYDRKRRIKDNYFQYEDKNPNKHSNVYQANFLARINQIAIKRQIRHVDSQGINEIIKEKQPNPLNKEPKKQITHYRYSKQYKSDAPKRKAKTELDEDEVKSIDSISDDLQGFEEKIKTRKSLTQSQPKRQKQKGKTQTNKLLPQKRWFYGMSTYYLQKNKPKQTLQTQQTMKSNCFDIQAEVQLISQLRSSSFSNKQSKESFVQSIGSTKNRQKLLLNKANHIAILKMI